MQFSKEGEVPSTLSYPLETSGHLFLERFYTQLGHFLDMIVWSLWIEDVTLVLTSPNFSTFHRVSFPSLSSEASLHLLETSGLEASAVQQKPTQTH